MFVTVTDFEGYGWKYVARLPGFPTREYQSPRDIAYALEYAAERLAEHIGSTRGGDGYGYPASELDQADGIGWWLIDVMAFSDDLPIAYVMVSGWYVDSSGETTESTEEWSIRAATPDEITDMIGRRHSWKDGRIPTLS